MQLPPADTITAIEFIAFMEEVWEKGSDEDYFRFEDAVNVAIELGATMIAKELWEFPNGAIVGIHNNGAGVYEPLYPPFDISNFLPPSLH